MKAPSISSGNPGYLSLQKEGKAVEKEECVEECVRWISHTGKHDCVQDRISVY